MLAMWLPACRLFPRLAHRQCYLHFHTTHRCSHLKTHYDVLDVDKNASMADIRAAFVAKSKQLHPDLNQNDPKTHEKFIQLTEAYNTLCKTLSRREYDFSLEAYLNRHRRQRPTSASHTAGHSSSRPGSGFNHPESDERVFWDETIWHMRDKSKDKDFEGKPYYSVKGLKRQPNSYVVAGIVIWIILGGATIHYFIFRMSRDYARSVMDKRDIHFHELYKEKRDNAKLHGNELQMELLKRRYLEENSKDS